MLKRVAFVIGKPGSGKSTAAALASQKIHAGKLSVGEELRAIAFGRKLSAFGDELAKYSLELKVHQPVPPSLTTAVFEECITNMPNKLIIVDGYPQYIDLLPGFEKAIETLNLHVVGICHILTPDTVARERLAAREQRSRDVIEDNEYITGRLSSYYNNTLPTVRRLSEKYRLFNLDGSQQKETVANDVARIITSAIE